MDQFINNLKAGFFTQPPGTPSILPHEVTSAANLLQYYGPVVDFIAFPEIVSLFRRTHERIYQVLGAIDNELYACNAPGVSGTWAISYSHWMTR